MLHDMKTMEIKSTGKGVLLNDTDREKLKFCTRISTEAIIACANQLNALNIEETIGTQFKNVAKSIQSFILHADFNQRCQYLSEFFAILSSMVKDEFNEHLGTVYGDLLQGMASKLSNYSEDQELNLDVWLSTLYKGLEVAMTCTDSEIERVECLVPLWSFTTTINEQIETGINLMDALSDGVSACESSAAEIFSETNPDNNDPSAHAVGIYMRGLLEGFRLIHNR